MAGTGKRGFAAMDADRRREVARRGGQAAHQMRRAHEFDAAEARAAGQKGGAHVAQDRAHMAEIGRRGGRSVSHDAAYMAEIGRRGGHRSRPSSRKSEDNQTAVAQSGDVVGTTASRRTTMPQDEKGGEVTGQDAGRKQVDSSVEDTHHEEHPEVGLKGGKRDLEHRDEEDREIINKTTVVNDGS